MQFSCDCVQSDVTFDQVLIIQLWTVFSSGLWTLQRHFAVFASGIWSGNCFIIFAVLNLEKIILLWLKHFDIALCKLLCWLEINVFIFMDMLCVGVNLQSDLCIKQRTDISLVFLLRHRRKDIYCHRHTKLVVFCGMQSFPIYQYGLNCYILPGYQETATVKIELNCTRCCQDPKSSCDIHCNITLKHWKLMLQF